jgi:ribosomal protein S18 acetylase RimI-like enzyme
MPAPAVRPATADDVPALAATLAAAFAEYPWTAYTVDPDGRERRLRELYAIYLDLAVRFGAAWTTDDRAAAAAWTWSEAAPAQHAHLAATGLGERIATLLGARLDAFARTEAALAARRPAEPHWTLAAVGVLPARQGAGLGTRVLEPMLRRLDARGQLAALETSTPANVRLYERLGFRVVAETRVTPDAPPTWLMRRPPSASAPGRRPRR